MALICPLSPPTIIQNSTVINKPVSRVLMLAEGQIPRKKTQLQIRSSSRSKVFEDRSKGIICYRDDNGEITCEGYDEGPRLQQQFSRMKCNSRDVEIIDLLQKSRLQIVEGRHCNHANRGIASQKDFNWNGFNTFC